MENKGDNQLQRPILIGICLAGTLSALAQEREFSPACKKEIRIYCLSHLTAEKLQTKEQRKQCVLQSKSQLSPICHSQVNQYFGLPDIAYGDSTQTIIASTINLEFSFMEMLRSFINLGGLLVYVLMMVPVIHIAIEWMFLKRCGRAGWSSLIPGLNLFLIMERIKEPMSDFVGIIGIPTIGCTLGAIITILHSQTGLIIIMLSLMIGIYYWFYFHIRLAMYFSKGIIFGILLGVPGFSHICKIYLILEQRTL